MIVALFCYIIIFIMNVPAAFTADRIPAIDSQGILFLYCSYFVYYFLPAFGYFSPYFGARPFWRDFYYFNFSFVELEMRVVESGHIFIPNSAGAGRYYIATIVIYYVGVGFALF